MKYVLPISELVIYIGLFIFLTIYLNLKTKKKIGNKIWIILAVSYVIGSFPLFSGIDYYLQLNNPFIEVMAEIGFAISGILIYFIAFLIIFLLIALVYFIIAKKNLLKKNNFVTFSLSIILLLSCTICIFGYRGTQNYKHKQYDINQTMGLKIVAISDLHFGTTCSTLNTNKLIKEVNKENPDVIFLLGDIFDNHVENLDKKEFTTFINSFSSTYGTYAILGNHELKQNSYLDAVSFYSDSNVKLLLDEEVVIANKIRVIGRIDLYFEQKYEKRKDLKQIIDGKNSSLPLIVLDHQPISYKEAIDVNAIMQLSGHTHNGQLFPYNLVIGTYYQIKYKCPIKGIKKFNNFNLIICIGSGTWGFPYKTSGTVEIISITI